MLIFSRDIYSTPSTILHCRSKAYSTSLTLNIIFNLSRVISREVKAASDKVMLNSCPSLGEIEKVLSRQKANNNWRINEGIHVIFFGMRGFSA